mgnify:CR=1 FL=1
MAIADFFDHTCNIYHVTDKETSPGYGLPGSPKFSYPAEPDEKGVACHFGVKNASVNVSQSEPANLMDAKIKLTLPVGTDIRLNDKVVNCSTRLEYTAEQPLNIRGHHLTVVIQRTALQEAVQYGNPC